MVRSYTMLINIIIFCDSSMQLITCANAHSQAAQKDQATEKADALFEAYKDSTDDCIGPEGQAVYKPHAWLSARISHCTTIVWR